MPVLGIADDEIEDGLAGRELDHRRMPDARVDVDDLIVRVTDAQHGPAGRLGLGGHGGGGLGAGRRRRERDKRDEE